MNNNRLPKHALNYKPRGQRDRGRPRKSWQCVDAETGQMTKSMEEDDDDDDDDDELHTTSHLEQSLPVPLSELPNFVNIG